MPLYVIPIVSGLGGVLLLGETFTIGMAVGAALIAAGVALINQQVEPIPA